MQSFSLISVVLSAIAGIASAYTQPVNGPIGNPISRPGLHEKVPVGKPYTITWNPNHHPESTITILFLKGPGNNIIPQYPIVEKAPNSGSYVWTPDASLPDCTEGYGIQLIVDDNGDYQWSTQFGFENDGTSEPEITTTTTEAPSTTPTDVATETETETEDPTTTTTEVEATTTAEEEEETTTTTTTIETTTAHANTTTTTVETTTTTTTTTEAEATTTEIEEDEPTGSPNSTTLATVTRTPSNTTIPSLPTQSDSGVGKNAASFAIALVALAVAGFSVL